MNKKSIYYKLLTVLLCTTILSSCGSKATVDNTAAAADTTVSTAISEMVTYDENDYYTEWENETPNYISLTGTSATLKGIGVTIKESNISITAAGVYVISGTLDDGQIIVDVKDEETVKLVLNGAVITCSDNSPIYSKSAGKTIISLQEGSQNTITDGKEYASTDDPNAAIFSQDDLTINGTGNLTVRGNYNDGITSKDDLKITGGNIKIYSADDGLTGKDLVAVKAGTIAIEAAGDGIKASTDISISGGTFKIDSSDDAVHSSKNVTITGGDLSIATSDDAVHGDETIIVKGGKINITKSYEGLESNIITISGGEIHVVASDDGINTAAVTTETGAVTDKAAKNGEPGQSTGTSKLNINGGYITVDASGDGLDSNGAIIMTSGTVIVSGPTDNRNGALDYDGTFVISGGLLMSAGSSGIAQATSEESTQNSTIMTYTEMQKAGTVVNLKDSKGNSVGTFTPTKDYQSVVISCSEIVKGETYSLYSGETSVDFTITSSVTWLNETGVTTGNTSN